MISYYDFNDVATVVDATLFKYNYIDNKILTLVKNQLDYRVVNDGSLLVSKEQLSLFLKENFQSDINRINATGFEQFHKEATTIYFLHKILTDFTNLEYIKLTINKNKSYSRLSDIDGIKTLRFNFKVLQYISVHAHICFLISLSRGELVQVNFASASFFISFLSCIKLSSAAPPEI